MFAPLEPALALETELPPSRTRRKPSYAIAPELRDYLGQYHRELELPISYNRLTSFRETLPLSDSSGGDTLWETVLYSHDDMAGLKDGLKHIYALLKVNGDRSVMDHLYVDRVDYCSYGHSMPFRIRIVNAINENADYFYLKQADASRIYGLELEHLLSPNRINYVTHGATLVEEHVAGLLTPDFEGWQVRVRAMDFDQQSYNGRRTFYLPQFFKENLPLVQFCTRLLDRKNSYQYQREERTLLLHRARIAHVRLEQVLEVMEGDDIAPEANVIELRQGLAEYFGTDAYLAHQSMGALVRENLRQVRLAETSLPPPR